MTATEIVVTLIACVALLNVVAAKRAVDHTTGPRRKGGLIRGTAMHPVLTDEQALILYDPEVPTR